MRALGEDLVAGLRAVRRRPGLAAAVVGVLAAGVGSVVTVFSVVDAFFLRPLPYPEAGRLVWIRSLNGGNPAGVSYADHLDLSRAPDLLDTALFSANDFSVLSIAGEAESALATRTTASLFSVLRVKPLLGRAWLAGEDRPDAGHSVVLSHDLWRLRFAADPAAIGRSVMVDGAPYTVAAVMPPGFHFPVRSDLWISSSPWADQWPWRDIRVGTMVARLRPGATLDAARAELAAISTRLERQYPATNSGIRAEALPLREVWTKTSRTGLLILVSACCLLLSITCANAASLLLVWAGAREVDTAVRIAVGIRPSRLIRQATIEALLLGLASGAMGLLLASWGVRLVARLLPGHQLPSWIEIRLDARSAVLATTLSLLVGLLAGLTPALRSRTLLPQALLRNTGMAGGASREAGRSRKGLAVAELALSLWLLASAGLVLESFSRLQAVDAGFGTRGVLAAEVQLPVLRLAGYQQVTALYRRLLERLQALPGVTAAGAATDLPLTPRETRILWELGVAGQALDERRRNPVVRGHVVSPGYFQALGLALLEGRGFEPRDAARATAGAIVSRSFAERFWPRRPAVGQALSLGAPGSHAPPMTVVGVVADVRYEHRSVAGDGLDLYVPLERLPSWPIQLVVRTRGRPLAIAAAVRRAVRSVSPDLAVRDAVPLAARVDRSLWRERMWATLLPIFAGVALLLSACGVYGAISQRVRQRSREIGIRLALGAVRRDVLRLVLGELAGICALGVGLGLAGCVASGRFLGALLYEVGSDDPVVLALTVAALVSISIVAAAIPLRKVLRIEPATALRWE
jgi:putative ABC transport system permease protein